MVLVVPEVQALYLPLSIDVTSDCSASLPADNGIEYHRVPGVHDALIIEMLVALIGQVY